MTIANQLVAKAEREAERARQTFDATFAELRARLDPRVLAQDSAQAAFSEIAGLTQSAQRKLSARPVAAAGIAAAVTAAAALLRLRNHRKAKAQPVAPTGVGETKKALRGQS